MPHARVDSQHGLHHTLQSTSSFMLIFEPFFNVQIPAVHCHLNPQHTSQQQHHTWVHYHHLSSMHLLKASHIVKILHEGGLATIDVLSISEKKVNWVSPNIHSFCLPLLSPLWTAHILCLFTTQHTLWETPHNIFTLNWLLISPSPIHITNCLVWHRTAPTSFRNH